MPVTRRNAFINACFLFTRDTLIKLTHSEMPCLRNLKKSDMSLSVSMDSGADSKMARAGFLSSVSRLRPFF